jgi:transposase
MMKVQDVILKAMAKKISWLEAAEIIGVCDRTMRRMRESYQQFGYTELMDRRSGKQSAHRVPMDTAEEVLRLYREVYFDLNIRHFHEKLRDQHQIELSYTWVQRALQGAGLVAKRHKRGPHRRRRPRRPLPGMLLHIDGSKHRWLQDDRWHDLIVILDDATSEIYYAQLVEEESTRTVMAALREVIETRGLFCSLYSDRGSHFFVTVKAGDKVDRHRVTQVGRALKELGVKMIAAYSPQARGRSERSFGTWQGQNAARWLDTAAFQVPAFINPGVPQPVRQFGSSGIGVIPGPNFFNYDMSVSKQFALHERSRSSYAARC